MLQQEAGGDGVAQVLAQVDEVDGMAVASGEVDAQPEGFTLGEQLGPGALGDGLSQEQGHIYGVDQVADAAVEQQVLAGQVLVAVLLQVAQGGGLHGAAVFVAYGGVQGHDATPSAQQFELVVVDGRSHGLAAHGDVSQRELDGRVGHAAGAHLVGHFELSAHRPAAGLVGALQVGHAQENVCAGAGADAQLAVAVGADEFVGAHGHGLTG